MGSDSKKQLLRDAPEAPVEKKGRNLQIYLTEDEWFRLLQAARTSDNPLRDETLLLLMYELGLRREEISMLRLSYAEELHERRLYVWRGKGSISGFYDLSDGTARKLHQLIIETYEPPRDPKAFIFKGSGAKTGFTGRGVYKMFNRLAYVAGLKPNARHPHILKRTRCQHILNEAVAQGLSADAVYKTLARIVGHKAALTTIRFYTAETDGVKELVKSVTKRLTAGYNEEKGRKWQEMCDKRRHKEKRDVK